MMSGTTIGNWGKFEKTQERRFIEIWP